MIDSRHHDREPGEDDTAGEQDVSAGLRAAVRDRPAPPPTWDLTTIKARGRRRRNRARALPIAAALLLLTGVGAAAAATDGSWPWATTTTVATSGGDDPDQVVRDYLTAREAGDNARAFDDYWIPGLGATLDVTDEPLVVDRVDVGPPQPEPTGPGTHAQGWPEAVSVPVTLHWDGGPGLTSGKPPAPGEVVLVRSGDDQPWRIISSFDFSGDYLPPALLSPPGGATAG